MQSPHVEVLHRQRLHVPTLDCERTHRETLQWQAHHDQRAAAQASAPDAAAPTVHERHQTKSLPRPCLPAVVPFESRVALPAPRSWCTPIGYPSLEEL